MTTSSLLLGAALLILVGLFLVRPFLLANAQYSRRKNLRQELLAEKDGILAEIQVLDFDYETGTIPEADYQQLRQQMVAEAAEILKRLDEFPGETGPTPTAGVESEIEAAIGRLRRNQPRQPAPKPVKPAPSPKPADIPAPTNGQVNFCPQCGKPVEKGDNFCAYCGHQIIQAQTT